MCFCRVSACLLVCCERGKRCRWRVERVVACIATIVFFASCRGRARLFLNRLLNFDDRTSTLTSWGVVDARVLSRRSVVVDARVCFFFLCPARSCGGAVLRRMRLARCCVRGWVLCARLDAVCARRCVRDSRFAHYFFLHHYSETRMLYFLPMQIAASCWLVAVMAQMTINAADAEALNQTLTGLGCWQSSTCKTKNFNCSSSGAVQCNANGSVTSL